MHAHALGLFLYKTIPFKPVVSRPDSGGVVRRVFPAGRGRRGVGGEQESGGELCRCCWG